MMKNTTWPTNFFSSQLWNAIEISWLLGIGKLDKDKFLKIWKICKFCQIAKNRDAKILKIILVQLETMQ